MMSIDVVKNVTKKLLDNPIILGMLCFLAGVVVCYFLYPTKKIETETQTKIEQQYKDQLQKQQLMLENEQAAKESQYQETIKSQSEEMAQKESEYKEKITTLNQNISNLNSQISSKWTKITKADGTVEETKEETKQEVSNNTSSSSRVAEIEQKYKEEILKIQQQFTDLLAQQKDIMSKQIASLSTEVQTKNEKIKELSNIKQIVEVNSKRFGLALGTDNNFNIVTQLNFHLTSSIFVGAFSHIDYNAIKSKPISIFGGTIGLEF